MQYRSWWVAAVTLAGCSGNVDLGVADAPSKPLADGAELVSFAPSPDGMCALFDDQRAYCWGKEGSTLAHRAPELDSVKLAGAGSQGEICGLELDGTVTCTTSVHQKRVKKLGLEGAVALSVGAHGGCALTAGGGLHCWSTTDATFGETFRHEDWLDLDLPSPAVQVDFKDNHGCAVTSDGHVYCFGSNLSGESGQPNADYWIAEPMLVPDIEDAVQVALGMGHTCVLRSSGTVTCFGDAGSIGDGQTAVGARRGDVSGLGGVIALKASRVATCALESSGRLQCWGISMCGSLGISEACDSTLLHTPLTVQPTLEIEDFGMDDGLLCALTSTQQIKCWGLSGWDGEALGSPLPRRIVF